MATPHPPLTPDRRLAIEQEARYDRLRRNVAIGGVILFPTIALLPPRKLDLYTFALSIGFYLSADQLSTSYTNRGLVQNLTPSWGGALPTEKARETQRSLQSKRAEGEREDLLREGREALQQGRKETGEGKDKGVLNRFWMGDEKAGWKERRLEEERKALEDGKTYTDLILEQIWEVWNWDRKKIQDKDGVDKPKKS